MWTIVSSPDPNSLSFNISSSLDIEHFLVLNVHDEVTFSFEDLPPMRVSTSDHQVVASAIALDVERVVLILVSNGSRSLMEVPNLSASAIWCFQNHIITKSIKISS